ncbi:MAG TPA: hypothetical protein VGR27_14755, partial [Longimicrobiaceae bacterium]|nr:hypothetical protein [Longimicrobiaceae bacterium]
MWKIGMSAALLCAAASTAAGQQPSAPRPLGTEQQIAAAVAPAPESLREGATVLGYGRDGRLTTLRQGTNELICLADQPGDDRFHVACYHNSLEPFMARGRELQAQGKERGEIQETRLREIESGALRMPDRPAALYSLTGPAGSFDPATGEVEGASPLYVVYTPYATSESTGLQTEAMRGAPWLMNPG